MPLLTPTEGGVATRGGPVELRLVSDECSLEAEDSRATARFTVQTGEAVDLALLYSRPYEEEGVDAAGGENDPLLDLLDVRAGLENAREGWQSWPAPRSSPA